MRYYIVWLRNTTSIRDDEPVKIKASSKEQAKEFIHPWLRNRFTIRDVYTLSEFKKIEPWWHTKLWGRPPLNSPKLSTKPI